MVLPRAVRSLTVVLPSMVYQELLDHSVVLQVWYYQELLDHSVVLPSMEPAIRLLRVVPRP
jgi:hypothetical protein